MTPHGCSPPTVDPKLETPSGNGVGVAVGVGVGVSVGGIGVLVGVGVGVGVLVGVGVGGCAQNELQFNVPNPVILVINAVRGVVELVTFKIYPDVGSNLKRGFGAIVNSVGLLINNSSVYKQVPSP